MDQGVGGQLGRGGHLEVEVGGGRVEVENTAASGHSVQFKLQSEFFSFPSAWPAWKISL